MPFKILIQISVLLTLILSLGCSDYLNGKKKESEVLELKNDKFACLNELPNSFKQLSLGESTETSITESFQCLNEALVFFNQRTKGSLNQSYSEEDLRKFFGKYFLKENNISKELSEELMNLKMALFGGDNKQVTKGELERVISFLGVVKEELIKINPYLKTLLFQKTTLNRTTKEIDTAIRQVHESFKRLISLVDIDQSEYNFDHLQSLAAGLYDFVAPKTKIRSFENIKQWLPFLKAVKQTLFGERTLLRKKSDWLLALDSLMQVYKLTLQTYYQPIEMKLTEAGSLQDIFACIDSLIGVVENSFLMKVSGEIPFSVIDELIMAAAQKGLITGSVQPTTWIETYKMIILRFLDQNTKLDNLRALTASHIQSLKIEYENLKLQQKEIDALASQFGSGGSLSPADLDKYLKSHSTKDVVEKYKIGAVAMKYMMSARNDLIRMWSHPFPVKFTGKGQNQITYFQNKIPWTWKSLTISHLVNAINRFFIRGYGDLGSGELNQRGLSEASFRLWYDDFMDLGIELKLFDPRAANAGSRSFKEANFFTPSGDGNQFMSYDESYEFLSNLFAAGIVNTSNLTEFMKKQGCATDEKDVFGLPYFEEGCFKRNLRKSYSEIFPNLNYQSKFVSLLNDRFWEEYYEAAMATARTEEKNKGIKVETTDIRTLVVILHYIENLYIIYDQNKNGYLDLDELRLASQRFHDFVKEQIPASPVGQEYLIREGFVTLVVLGHKPTAQDLLSFKWSETWNRVTPVSRINILKTFAALKDDLKKTAK